MKITITDKSQPAAYTPKLTNGGVNREPDGTLRLYWYPYFEEGK